MREIMLRVIDPNTKKVIGIETWDIMFGWAFVIHPDDTVRAGTFPDGIDRNIRNLFTGLHDKNGKYIYEGDVLLNEFGKKIVKWDDTSAAFYLDEFEFTIMKIWFWSVDFGKIEIIGNIYENPELVK